MKHRTRPPEIPQSDWDVLTSPENFYMDGEVSRAQAEKIFDQRIDSIIAQYHRRASTPELNPIRNIDIGQTMVHYKKEHPRASRTRVDAFGLTLQSLRGNRFPTPSEIQYQLGGKVSLSSVRSGIEDAKVLYNRLLNSLRRV